MRLVSWNVNGLRAVVKRGDFAWVFADDIDVLCLQESKMHEDQVEDVHRPPAGWQSFWSFGVKKGYSGTAVFVRGGIGAKQVPFTIGGTDHPDYDSEGRVVAVDFDAFTLLNVYFPNGGRPERLAFKHAWHDAFLKAVLALQKNKPVVITGDLNVAHRPVDVAEPEKWATQSGF